MTKGYDINNMMIKQSDVTRWFYKAGHNVMTQKDDKRWWHKLITHVDNTKWRHKVMKHVDKTK